MRMYFIFDRRHVATNEKEANVELRIYFARHSEKTINTGIKLFADEWDGYVINRKDAQNLNAQLAKLRKEQEKIIHDMKVNGIEPNLNNFNSYTGDIESIKEEVLDSFLDFLHDEIEKNTIRDTTKRQHFVAYEELKKFGKIKSFASLNIRNIELFDTYLRRDNRQQSTIFDYINVLSRT